MSQNRAPKGVHEGGQFATSARTEADVRLDGATFNLHLDESVDLDTSHLDELPEWPFAAQPMLDYDLGEDDHFGIELVWDGNRYGAWYEDGQGSWGDSFDIGDGPADVSADEREALRVYGKAALLRAYLLAGEVTTAAHRGLGRAVVQNLALGRSDAVSRLDGVRPRG